MLILLNVNSSITVLTSAKNESNIVGQELTTSDTRACLHTAATEQKTATMSSLQQIKTVNLCSLSVNTGLVRLQCHIRNVDEYIEKHVHYKAKSKKSH